MIYVIYEHFNFGRVLGGLSQLVSSQDHPYLQTMNGYLEGKQPHLGDLLIIVANYLQNGIDSSLKMFRTPDTSSFFGDERIILGPGGGGR